MLELFDEPFALRRAFCIAEPCTPRRRQRASPASADEAALSYGLAEPGEEVEVASRFELAMTAEEKAAFNRALHRTSRAFSASSTPSRR